jgi:hypothetical protein
MSIYTNTAYGNLNLEFSGAFNSSNLTLVTDDATTPRFKHPDGSLVGGDGSWLFPSRSMIIAYMLNTIAMTLVI